MIETDVCILGGGPGGLSAATTLALGGRRVIVVNAGPLMGYGIEGAFKSKAEFEITRQYVYTAMRPDVFGKAPPPTFAEPATNAKLQPKPSRNKPTTATETIEEAGATNPDRIMIRLPAIITGPRPNRSDSAPETGANANIPSVWAAKTIEISPRLCPWSRM